MKIEPSAGSSVRAAAAMCSFSAVIRLARSSIDGSNVTFSAGMALPCTRRMTPRRSSSARSRRIVSPTTANRSASAVTEARPSRLISARIASWRLTSDLAELNVEYAAKRDSLRLGAVRLEVLPAGAWREWDRKRVAADGRHPGAVQAPLPDRGYRLPGERGGGRRGCQPLAGVQLLGCFATLRRSVLRGETVKRATAGFTSAVRQGQHLSHCQKALRPWQALAL